MAIQRKYRGLLCAGCEETLEFNTHCLVCPQQQNRCASFGRRGDGEKQSEIEGLSVSPLTAFVGALTAVGAEEEEGAESPWDSEVFPVKDTGVPSGAGVGSEIQKHSELGPCRG